MLLVSARVGPFKSIDEPQAVKIDPKVTVLVGMNEAGKTVFLKALEKSRDALLVEKFDPVDDYPRKDLTKYLKQHPQRPAIVVDLVFELTATEIAAVKTATGATLAANFQFGLQYNYANGFFVQPFPVDELAGVAVLSASEKLSSDSRAALQGVPTLRAAAEALKKANLTEDDKTIVAALDQRIGRADAARKMSTRVRQNPSVNLV